MSATLTSVGFEDEFVVDIVLFEISLCLGQYIEKSVQGRRND